MSELVTAFLAGALALLSPCTAPILPGVASAILGTERAGRTWWGQAARVGLFAVGAGTVLVGSVAIVFVAAIPVDFARPPYSVGAGLVLIALGLSNLGLIKVPWAAPAGRQSHAISFLRPLLLGMTCAAVWYPCLGPSLALTYGLAGRINAVPSALVLAVAYFLGLTAPLVIVGIVLVRVPATSKRIKTAARIVNFALSILLIIMGALLVTGLWLYVSTRVTDGFAQFPAL